MWGTMAKSSFSFGNGTFRPALRVFLATLPAAAVLAGCVSGNQGTQKERPNVMADMVDQPIPFADFSQPQQMAACSLFIDAKPARGIYLSPSQKSALQPTPKNIAISQSPENDLGQAIALELGGYQTEARKLYLWLTAANPGSTFTMPCGNGVSLSSTISRLAQHRLAAMDNSNPNLAQSAEINDKVELAKVAPGPSLPNPPKVERNTDFYLTAGPVDVMPEDNRPQAPAFAIQVSPNTEALARVTPPKEPVTLDSDNVVRISDVTTRKPDGMHADSDILELTGGVGTASVGNSGLQPNSNPTEDGNLQSMPAAPHATEIAPAPVADDMVPGADETKLAETASSNLADAPIDTQKKVPPAEPSHQQARKGIIEKSERQGPPLPKASPAPALGTTGRAYYALQLAAYRSREIAEASWLKIQKNSNGLLDGIDHEIRTLAVKDKGLYFRLLTGHFAEKSVAIKVCEGFKKEKMDCIVRHIEP
jgi:hypothetical protein|tara:strand:+ start:26476 stop:27915 length:1440 start_codon:yes stop_codon:yes gene_type:complete